jgi:hypothetical protein
MPGLNGRYFGKYRGTVVDNLDEHKLGRLEVLVPDVHQDKPVWAEPCSPYAGPGRGFFFIPPIDSKVWVEFEGGNPESAIWAGGFWDDKGPPPEEALTESYPMVGVLKTGSVTLWIDDEDGGLHLTIGPPLDPPVTIVVGPSGLTVNVAQSVAKVAEGQITLSVDDDVKLDLTEGATLQSSDAISLQLSDNGVEVASSANVAITGDAVNVTGSLDVNSGALAVEGA